MPYQRRDLAASVALLWIQTDSEGHELSWITIKPDIKPGNKADYVDRTLRALDAVLREIRTLDGPWSRFVGTISVTISAAGSPSWAAHPHLHLIAPTAIAEWIKGLWESAEEAVGLPVDSRPKSEQRTHPVVQVKPIEPGPASLSHLARYLQQARWTNLSPKRASHPLGAIARTGSRMVSEGNGKAGWAWLDAWRETVVAIWNSGVSVGLKSHRRLKQDAEDLVQQLELAQRSSSEDVQTVVSTVLGLRPFMGNAEALPLALVRHRDAEKRSLIDAARDQIRQHGGINRPFFPGPARAASLSVLALVPPRKDRVHLQEASASLPVRTGAPEDPVYAVVPCARPPPHLHVVLAFPDPKQRSRIRTSFAQALGSIDPNLGNMVTGNICNL